MFLIRIRKILRFTQIYYKFYSKYFLLESYEISKISQHISHFRMTIFYSSYSGDGFELKYNFAFSIYLDLYKDLSVLVSLFSVKKFVIHDKLTTLDRVTLFASELIATGILVFVGCLGCVTRIAGGSIPHEQISWTFGLAVMIAIQVSLICWLNIDELLMILKITQYLSKYIFMIVSVLAMFLEPTSTLSLQWRRLF